MYKPKSFSAWQPDHPLADRYKTETRSFATGFGRVYGSQAAEIWLWSIADNQSKSVSHLTTQSSGFIVIQRGTLRPLELQPVVHPCHSRIMAVWPQRLNSVIGSGPINRNPTHTGYIYNRCVNRRRSVILLAGRCGSLSSFSAVCSSRMSCLGVCRSFS